MTWVVLGVIGFVAGIASGLFGIGGALVMVPGLVLVLKLSQHTANGTSLAALLLPVGILGVLEYHRRGQVNVGFALVLAGGLLLGALLGAQLAGALSDLALRRVFGGVLLLVAARFLLGH